MNQSMRAQANSRKDNQALVLDQARELWNANDLDGVQRFFAPSFVGHLGSETISGTLGMRNFIGSLFEAFPDIHMAINDVFGSAEQVASRWQLVGTHKGEFMGTPPSGRRVTMRGMAIWRFFHGKIIEAWLEVDFSQVREPESPLVPRPPVRGR